MLAAKKDFDAVGDLAELAHVELAVLAFVPDDFGAAVGPVADVVACVLGFLFVRRVYGEPPKGSSKKVSCFLGTAPGWMS